MPDNRVDVLIPSDAIERKVTELGARISKDYAGRMPLLLIGVLKGSFIFLADLCRRLGRTAEARSAYERALELTHQVPERRFLERRLGAL